MQTQAPPWVCCATARARAWLAGRVAPGPRPPPSQGRTGRKQRRPLYGADHASPARGVPPWSRHRLHSPAQRRSAAFSRSVRVIGAPNSARAAYHGVPSRLQGARPARRAGPGSRPSAGPWQRSGTPGHPRSVPGPPLRGGEPQPPLTHVMSPHHAQRPARSPPETPGTYPGPRSVPRPRLRGGDQMSGLLTDFNSSGATPGER